MPNPMPTQSHTETPTLSPESIVDLDRILTNLLQKWERMERYEQTTDQPTKGTYQ